MELFISVMIFVLGLCCGSFVNMLVYRTAVRYKLEKSKILNSKKNKNRSFCDFCGKQLHWYENVPVVSWLALGGKSGCCHKKLPPAYPVVELGMGILFLINQTNWLGMAAITLLVFLTVFDAKYMILPDFVEYILIGLAVAGLLFRQDWRQCLAMGVVFYGFFWLLSKLKIKGKQAMGSGDAPLALFIGLWLGWPEALVAFYTAFIVGAIAGGGMMLAKKKRGDSQIPFGPFLILGTFLAWWGGKTILRVIGL